MISTDTNSTKKFFIAQSIGWVIFGWANFLIQWYIGLPLFLVLTNTACVILSGFTLTTAYRYLIKDWKWGSWSLQRILLFIGLSTFLLSLSWLVFNAILISIWMTGIQISSKEIISNMLNGGLLFLIWNLIYFFYKYFGKSQQLETDKWRLSAEVKEAQLGTLRAQVRPHFVFNTLNNIKALVLEDPHRSREMLINFSDLLRYSLQHNEQKQVALEDEVEISQQYLELMSIQYEDRLKWSMEIAPASLTALLPPMLLQLLVENGVKHGIATSAEVGQLIIKTQLIDEVLILEVQNSGSLSIHANVEGRLGTGLKNIRERLRIFYGEQASFSLEEEAPHVVARVKIPQQLKLVRK